MSRSAVASRVRPPCASGSGQGRRGALLSTWLCSLALTLAAGAAAADSSGLPTTLRDTGFHDAWVRAALIEFSPQYPLWSDGARKRRWMYLPPGSHIDAANPDAWEFPRGTKFWKEFSHGAAIETRYVERGDDGVWRYASYLWNAQGTEATLAPAAGLRDLPVARAPGGRYTIPAENDCRACHEGAPVPVLGFSALQLSSDRDSLAPHGERDLGVDLSALYPRGLLRNLPEGLFASPPRIVAASRVERASLGYLHGNCGHCHNADGPLAVLELNLAQRLGARSGAVRRSIIGVPSQSRVADLPAGSPRIAPGHVGGSALAHRMRSRDPLQQMPPLGTAVVDDEALALVAEWIETLSH